MEERGPINKGHDPLEREPIQHFDADKRRCRDLRRLPIDGGLSLASLRQGQQRFRAAILVGLTHPFLVEPIALGKPGLLSRIHQTAHHPHCPGGIKHVDDRLRVSRGNLDGRMGFAGRGASDKQGHLESFSSHLARDVPHFIQGRGNQAAEPD